MDRVTRKIVGFLLLRKTSTLVIAAMIVLPIGFALPACSRPFPRQRPVFDQPTFTPSNQSIPTQSLYKPNLGSYTVGVADDLSLFDSRRKRQLPVKVYYPQGQGSFPVIIFSHGGGGGSKEGFSYLGEFWASQGYISIHPSHSDSSSLRETEDNAQPLEYRPQDVSFVIDSLQALEGKIPQLRGKIDRARIGVAGHSFGAYSALWMAGQMVDTAQRKDVSFRDPRVRAFLAISPPGTGRGGLDERSWDRITAPVMIVSGSNERGDDWRMEPFKNMPAGNKYYLLFQDAYHSSYNDYKPGGRRGLMQDRETIQNIHTHLQSASIAFWDSYLKQDNAAKQFLQSDALPGGNMDAPLSSNRDVFPRSNRDAFPRRDRLPSSGGGQVTLFKK
ncbi:MULTISPECIES: alpha/beta hydrolase family protein [Cyanophyceae]|uniref:alpha/beta hydrolase family protein n=1 Tax=Cyanophyceae TaxID=3028117 RepID=UPI001F54C4EE|nr:hypothetical protein [Trichocoleus sp. FACHB-40]